MDRKYYLHYIWLIALHYYSSLIRSVFLYSICHFKLFIFIRNIFDYISTVKYSLKYIQLFWHLIHSSNTDDMSNIFHFEICSVIRPLNGDKSNFCKFIISVSNSLFISFQFAIVDKCFNLFSVKTKNIYIRLKQKIFLSISFRYFLISPRI